jgi:hypothetical protein
MHIATLKRWQWAVVGLALGLAVSFYRGWVAADATLESRQTLDSTEFEQILAKKSTAGQPMVKDIRYFGQDDSIDWVIANQLVRRGRGVTASEAYVPVKIAFDRPYKPRLNRPLNLDANFTVVDYLKLARAKNPEVRYSTRWWDREPVRSPLFALLGMAVMAGACPLLMNRIGGGEQAKRDEPEYDLSRFGKGGPEPERPAKTGPTEADIAHLRDLEAELERKLAAGAEPAVEADSPSLTQPTAAQNGSTGPIRKLDAGPLESQSPADAAKHANKEFAGEFYPTETHVKHDKSK